VADEEVHAALRAGASGYLGKHVPGPVLIDAIRRVASGETVLGLIAEGPSNREIGQRMRLAPSTVKNYVPQLLAKLGLKKSDTSSHSRHAAAEQPTRRTGCLRRPRSA
jgi:two-component system response regulator DevR